nr:VOC family protein [Sphingomonas bacterium]
MPHLAHLTLLVRDYDEAFAFYVGKLGFELVEDTAEPGKRWVTIRPPNAPLHTATILLPSAAFPTMLRIAGTLRRLRPRQHARAGGADRRPDRGPCRVLPPHRRLRARPRPLHRRWRRVGPPARRPALWPRCGVEGPVRQPLGPDSARPRSPGFVTSAPGEPIR